MTTSNCCSLEPKAFAERAATWRSLASALIDRQPTPTGAVLRYRLDPRVAEVLLELLDAERQCCPSLSLEAVVELSIDAPEESRPWVARTFLAPTPAAEPVEARHVEEIQKAVEKHYAEAARRVSGCCGNSPGRCEDQMTGIGASAYDTAELKGMPAQAVAASVAVPTQWLWPSWFQAR